MWRSCGKITCIIFLLISALIPIRPQPHLNHEIIARNLTESNVSNEQGEKLTGYHDNKKEPKNLSAENIENTKYPTVHVSEKNTSSTVHIFKERRLGKFKRRKEILHPKILKPSSNQKKQGFLRAERLNRNTDQLDNLAVHQKYVVEILPDDRTTLRPYQWMYFRICIKRWHQYIFDATKSSKEEQSCRLSYFDTMDDSQGKARSQHTCRFHTNHYLIVHLNDTPIFSYTPSTRILVRHHWQLQLSDVRVWLHLSHCSLLVALRLPALADDSLFQLQLRTKSSIYGSGGNSQTDISQSNPFMPLIPRSKTLVQFFMQLSEPTTSIHLTSNKTDPMVVYIPEPMYPESDSKFRLHPTKLIRPNLSTTVYTDWLPPLSEQIQQPLVKEHQVPKLEDPYVKLREEVELLARRKSALLFSHLFPTNTPPWRWGATSKWRTCPVFDTDKPNPSDINRVMDEMVSWKAKSIRAQLGHKFVPTGSEIPTHTTPTTYSSHSILIPTEPTSPVPVFVVRVGEVIAVTCSASLTVKALDVVYDAHLWRQVTRKEYRSTGFVKLELVLRATKITRQLPADNHFDDPLEIKQSEQFTSIDCGFYSPTQLFEPALFPIEEDTPRPEHLFFTIVSAKDYEICEQIVETRLQDYFGRHNTGKMQGSSLNNSETEKKEDEGVEARRSIKLSGFQLITLSGFNVAICLGLVGFILLLALLLVRDYIVNRRRSAMLRHTLSPAELMSGDVEFGRTQPKTHRHIQYSTDTSTPATTSTTTGTSAPAPPYDSVMTRHTFHEPETTEPTTTIGNIRTRRQSTSQNPTISRATFLSGLNLKPAVTPNDPPPSYDSVVNLHEPPLGADDKR